MKTSAFLLSTLTVLASIAFADDHRNKYGGENRGKPVLPSRPNALWQQECGSCHIAYAPGLLPPNPGES